MESSAVIITIAQLALALAGFSGIIVSLNPIPIREWDSLSRLNFRVLLQVAGVATFFAILPFPIHNLVDTDLAWKISLLLYGAYHIFDVSSFILKFPKEVLPINRRMSYLGLIIAIFQILIGVVGNPNWIESMYVIALIWHLSVSFFGFVMLVYGIKPVNDD
jgi:hypothetical protein